MNATGDKANFNRLALAVKVGIAAIAMTGVIGMQRSQLEQAPLSDISAKQIEQQEAARLGLMKHLPTFGYDNLIADWIFLNFLQYYGDVPARNQTGYSLSPEYFDLITKLDPRFVDSYLFLSYSISYQLGEPALAIKLMERGTTALSPQVHPSAFRVWRYKALDQLLLLGDIPGAIHSYEMAATWAKNVDEELANNFLATANFLRKDPNNIGVRRDAWAAIYVEAASLRDKRTQKIAEQELQKLGWGIAIKNKAVRLYPLRPQPAKAKPNSLTPNAPRNTR